MRKQIIAAKQLAGAVTKPQWLPVEELAEVEMTSEDTTCPIESALLPDQGGGWRAAEPGKQTIRFVFLHPVKLRRIQLRFVESETNRTQEYVLRWSPDGGHSFQEIVRQQWNFDPQGSTAEYEDHYIRLAGVTLLELSITPDIAGGSAFASLAQLRLA